MKKFLSIDRGKSSAPEIMAVLGGIIYAAQAFIYIQHRLPNLDEVAYLLKGYWLAQGFVRPFQPYSVWINKMYLSFYSWGWVESIFGPGLLAPRLFAIFLGLLTLVGVWILSRRLGGRWLAALAVLVVALNPTIISIYSRAVSEILVTCSFTWMLVFAVGEKKPTWSLIAAAILAGIMVFTRENMVFALPLLAAYIFWQHGRRKGLFATLTMVVVFIVGQLPFLPGILQLWFTWLPHELVMLVYNPATANIGKASLSMSTHFSLLTRLHSLAQAIRIHLVPFAGSLTALILLPRRKDWQKESDFRAAIFLGTLFFVMFFAHAWASVGKNYCVFCLRDYFAFFENAGIFFIVLSIRSWVPQPSPARRVALVALIVLVAASLGFSLFQQLGDTLLKFPLPRLRSGKILSGAANLWQVLANKFHVEYADARQVTPVVFMLLIGSLLVGILVVIYRRKHNHGQIRLFTFCIYGFLILGVTFSPLMNYPFEESLCSNNIIASYQVVGASLESITSPGMRIYIDGSISAVPLLYSDDRNILYAQLNDTYSYRIGGDDDALLEKGFWNESISREWRKNSEVFIIQQDRFSKWREYFTTDQFDKVKLPENLFTCPDQAYLYIYKRK